MRKFLFAALVVAAIFVSFTGCAKKNVDNIYGDWFITYFEGNGKKMMDVEDGTQESHLMWTLSPFSMTFNEDGTCRLKGLFSIANREITEGTFEMKDGNQLIISTNSGDNLSVNIVSITKEKLVTRYVDNSGEVLIMKFNRENPQGK